MKPLGTGFGHRRALRFQYKQKLNTTARREELRGAGGLDMSAATVEFARIGHAVNLPRMIRKLFLSAMAGGAMLVGCASQPASTLPATISSNPATRPVYPAPYVVPTKE